jgi:hypothetical protein
LAPCLIGILPGLGAVGGLLVPLAVPAGRFRAPPLRSATAARLPALPPAAGPGARRPFRSGAGGGRRGLAVLGRTGAAFRRPASGRPAALAAARALISSVRPAMLPSPGAPAPCLGLGSLEGCSGALGERHAGPTHADW